MQTQACQLQIPAEVQKTAAFTGQGCAAPPPHQPLAASAVTQAPPAVAGGNQKRHSHSGPTAAAVSVHTVAVADAAGLPPSTGAQGLDGNGPSGPILMVRPLIF